MEWRNTGSLLAYLDMLFTSVGILTVSYGISRAFMWALTQVVQSVIRKLLVEATKRPRK